MRRLFVTVSLALGLLYFGQSSESQPATTAQPKVATKAAANRMLQRQPDCFVPNVGQWQHGARYVARFGAMTVFLQEQG